MRQNPKNKTIIHLKSLYWIDSLYFMYRYVYVTFYRGNKLEKKSYYIYQKSLYYPTVQRMKCRSVVLGYLGTQDQSYFMSMLPAGKAKLF